MHSVGMLMSTARPEQRQLAKGHVPDWVAMALHRSYIFVISVIFAASNKYSGYKIVRFSFKYCA